jgi:glycosyltransferase involved in cell wall biosynthesis
MKILIVNFSDKKGGASRAAKRLHNALLDEKIDSTMFVLDKNGDEFTIITPQTYTRKITAKIQTIINPFPLRNKKIESPFSVSFSPSFNIVKSINKQNADIVHLHWINAGMLRIEDLAKINAPIVWSLHDMWPFTGGCHYADLCKLYMSNCGTCPVLNSDEEHDLSRKIFNRKNITYAKIPNLTIVGLSKWLKDCAISSTLFKERTVVNLPNPINTTIYKPCNQEKARDFFGLSNKKKYILFGAMFSTTDTRKGFEKLKDAFVFLEKKNIELLVFGSEKPINDQNFGFKTHYLGEISKDSELKKLYNASDVMVVPSLQENLSNVIMESLSCANPVVAFNIGGNKDLINHKENGYLAKPLDAEDLALGIEWVLKNNDTNDLSKSARLKVLENFDNKVVAKRYKELYNELINKSILK